MLARFLLGFLVHGYTLPRLPPVRVGSFSFWIFLSHTQLRSGASGRFGSFSFWFFGAWLHSAAHVIEIYIRQTSVVMATKFWEF